MLIWILALLLLASLAALGYRQGAIRVAFSFLGILFGALLAVPLGQPLGRLLIKFGVQEHWVAWAIGPAIVFVIFSIIFKAIAATVHHKVDVHYKYHAGDLRLALWERLNRRLGLCLGFLNGTAYLVLIAFVIYFSSYVTVQFATSDEDPRWMRLMTAAGRGLHDTGFAKVARSIDSIDPVKYDMADLAGLLYHNPLLQARLNRYPGFLGLAERQEFQDLGADQQFTEAWLKAEPIMTLAESPKIIEMRAKPELLKSIWDTTVPVLSDLRAYLDTGRSAKFDAEKILGRWNIDVNATVFRFRRSKTSVPSTEMQKVRRKVTEYARASLVAMPDRKALLKNMPPAPSAAPQNFSGEWKGADGKYMLSFSGQDESVQMENDRLLIKREGLDLVFLREI